MKSLHSITFLSDFGTGGGYVAACEATMVRVCPQARVFHISHDVPVGDVAAASLVLARVAPLFPESVHLAVVDPGVGTTRRPLALATRPGRSVWWVPTTACSSMPRRRLERLRRRLGARHREGPGTYAGLPLEGVSSTFHGRDLFAPASALLASGADPRTLGRPLGPPTSCGSSPVAAKRTAEGVSAPVIEIDRFGNVGLGVEFAHHPGWGRHVWRPVPGRGRRRRRAGMDGPDGANIWRSAPRGELGLIRDSWGQAALALNGASAAEFLGVRRGVMVTLTPAQR